MTRPTIKPRQPHPQLDALLERAKCHTITKAESDAQRRSWVIGETMLERPNMTREDAERIYNEIISK